MNKRKRATIRTLFAVGYTDSLRKARKVQKGLKSHHIQGVLLVGEYSEGLRCIDAAALCGCSRDAMYKRLYRCIVSGYIVKRNKLYFLTDSGLSVYVAMCSAFDDSLRVISRALLEDSR